MALQTSSGQVRISFSTPFDQASMTVNWMTFRLGNWRELNPQRVYSAITERGSHSFDLTIKEIQSFPLAQPYEDENGIVVTHENREVIIGYLPQSMEQAHTMLRNLDDGKEARFKNVNWQVV